MICLVTDRRSLLDGGGAAAGGSGAWRACLAAQVRYAVDAGVDLIHVRERDLDAGALAALVAELLAVAAHTRTRIVVNDRLDVALACGADGVHLRGDSIPVSAARQLAPKGFLVGRSVHGVEGAAAAAGADYLIAGTVFTSASKPAATPLLGIEGLKAIVRAVDCPVLAIGGITGDRIAEVAAAGAAGFAAIGLFMADRTEANTGCRAAELRQIVTRARAPFDRLNTTP
jgi:thiamine-phosphate pyrophosphorylase